MKFYIELWSMKKMQPVLGNLDGQGVIHAKLYKRTNQYKALKVRLPKVRNFYNDQSMVYHITSSTGTLLEVITNDY